jgi:HSP20 family protein
MNAGTTTTPPAVAPAKPVAPARTEPMDMFRALREEMARFWDRGWDRSWDIGWPRAGLMDLWPGRGMTTAGAWAPRMDVYQKNGNLVIKAELPGLTKDDVQLTLDRGDLVIAGHKKAETEVKEDEYYRMERAYGTFTRRVPLPFEVTPEQVTANFADGVLEVTLPKPDEKAPTATPIKIGT